MFRHIRSCGEIPMMTGRFYTRPYQLKRIFVWSIAQTQSTRSASSYRSKHPAYAPEQPRNTNNNRVVQDREDPREALNDLGDQTEPTEWEPEATTTGQEATSDYDTHDYTSSNAYYETDVPPTQPYYQPTTYSTSHTPSHALDKIFLKNMRFFAYHGCFPHENANGQPFEVDLELEVDLTRPGQTDDLVDTIDYGGVHASVKKIMEGPPKKLLEHLSLRIIDEIMDRFHKVYSVKIQIRKPHVGLKGQLDCAAVEMWRVREDASFLAGEEQEASYDPSQDFLDPSHLAQEESLSSGGGHPPAPTPEPSSAERLAEESELVQAEQEGEDASRRAYEEENELDGIVRAVPVASKSTTASNTHTTSTRAKSKSASSSSASTPTTDPARAKFDAMREAKKQAELAQWKISQQMTDGKKERKSPSKNTPAKKR